MPNEMWMGVPPDARPNEVKVYDVVSPKPGVRLTCTILDSRVLGLWTHFETTKDYPRGRSWLCHWEEGRCERCYRKLPQIWQGYVGVWCHSLCKRIVLCLGLDSALELRDFAKKYGGLHLLKFVVRKPETGTRAKLIFEESEHVGSVVDLAPFDFIPSVARALSVACLPDYRYTARELSEREVPNE